MVWTVTLEVALTDTKLDIDAVGDDLLTALLRDAELAGIVTFTNAAQRTVGATFDVEALSVEQAVNSGMAGWSRATQNIGLDTQQFLHVEIDRQVATSQSATEPAQAIA